MKFIFDLEEEILHFIENSELDEINIGCSSAQVIKINKSGKTYFLKIATKGTLLCEYQKLKWLDKRLKVPKVVMYKSTNDADFLITEALTGEMLCSKTYKEDPILGVKVLVQAFEEIYAVDIKDCPFDTSIDYRLSKIKQWISNKDINEKNINSEILKKYGSIENILKYLDENKFYDELCFSFGDISLPNVFGKDTKLTGFIDVGECGIADKWFDLAICEKSIKRNYGEEYISEFYNRLRIIPDRNKIDYYLLMMEVYV